MKNVLLLTLATLLVGCASASLEADTELAPTEAVVFLGDDGASVSTTRPASVTRATCADADLQLWDSSSFTGSTLCVIGSGRVDLSAFRYTPACGSKYCYSPPGLTWAGRVRSYRMAPYPAQVTQLAEPYASRFTDGTCGSCVRAGEQRSVATSCASRARTIDVVSLPTYQANPALCR